MDYKEQLKHPKWQKKRLQIMQRDNYTCQICGSDEKQLHVHHRFYIKGRKVWEYDNDVLITLCEGCHKKEHLSNKLLEIEKQLLEHFNEYNEQEKESIIATFEILKVENLINEDFWSKFSNAFNNTYTNVIIDFIENINFREEIDIRLWSLSEDIKQIKEKLDI